MRGTILRPSVQRYPEGAVSRDVGTEGAGSGKTTIALATARADLELSLSKLVEAHSAKTPADAIRLLAAGKQAYEDAGKKAKQAGSDWQL